MSENVTELILLRHAPVAEQGRLFGRTDAAPDLSDTAMFTALRNSLPELARIVSSPAQRCQGTARALFPDRGAETDPDLWEQDYGSWEGIPYGDIPDIGTLADEALADYAPEGGESFRDVVARTGPALSRLAAGPGPVLVSVHAGVIRAILAHALGGSMSALRFKVPNLSTTAITCLPGDRFAIHWVSRLPL